MITLPRVLQVLDRGNLAGTELHVLRLSERLVERGWQIDLAVSFEGPILRQFERVGIPIHKVSRSWRFSSAYIAGLRRIVREKKIAIVHAHSGRAASVAARLGGAIAVETRHGLGPIARDPRSLRLRREAMLCWLSDRTVTVCACDRDLLVACGLPADRVVHVPNGVPEPAAKPVLDPAGAPLRLAFVGRLAVQKDPLFLVELCTLLEQLEPDRWRLTIAGTGPLEGELRRGFERAKLGPRIEWMGEISQTERIWNRVDLLLLPSRWEGQPLVVLEAMAAGVPTLASRIDPLVELLDRPPAAGVTEDRDPSLWCGILRSLAGRSERWATLSRGARRRFDMDHRIEAMVERIESVYRSAFAQRRPR